MADEPGNEKTVVVRVPPAGRSTSPLHQNALPVGTMLGEFEIVDLVGEGGFGIVYLAQDHSLHRKVAIKEYMPALLASRGQDASVSVRSERQRETFALGLRSFVNEARMLARFDHPALIKVYRFWEANGTAYMAMPFLAGQTLQDVLRQRGQSPREDWIRGLLAPLMDALAVLHQDRIYHRDIAPDNIMLLAGDQPVLLDFGAARRVISETTHDLTVILKPGYAPIEQYADRPGMKQGPWTDVYALAAVVYFMILGRKPPPAVGRLMDDSYEPLLTGDAAGRYSARLLHGIDSCLRVKPEDRPQSMAAMREAIDREPPSPPPPVSAAPLDEATVIDVPAAPPLALAPATEPAVEPTEAGPFHFPQLESADLLRPPAPRTSKLPLVAGSVLAVVLLAGGFAYYASHRAPPASAPTATVATAPPGGNIATPAVAPPPAPTPMPRIASLTSAIDAALAAADPRLAVALQAPARVPLGDELKLSVRSQSDGTLYLFAWDQAMDKVHRLVGDEKAGGTAIKANAGVALTYRDTATRAAKDPPGNWLVISMLSEKPRDFSTTAFGRDGDVAVVDRSALESQLAVNGLASLFGTAQCGAGENCQDHFAIAVADVARDPAPQAPAAKRAPGPKASQNAPGHATPPRKANESEREYMKRLDKDLDSLLGK
jgi:serine/threonine protein kinase